MSQEELQGLHLCEPADGPVLAEPEVIVHNHI